MSRRLAGDGHRHFRVWALVAAASLLASAPARGQVPAGASADGVRAVVEGIIAADNAGDLERVLGYYADDAMLLPPNEEPIRGKAAIRPRYEGLFQAFLPEIVGDIDELQVAGEWAFVRGRNRGRLTPRAGGEPRTLNDVYLMLLRRDEGGSWRIAHLIWHSAGPS